MSNYTDLERSNGSFDRRLAGVGVAILGLIGTLVGLDLIGDARSGIELQHLALEGAVLALSGGGVVYLCALLWRFQRNIGALEAEVAVWQASAERWRGEARGLLDGLGAAIDTQFAAWSLSQAEREIGLLLIKGLSLKEIADLRQTSERTVRQQAQSAYRKAGLHGRAELAAFFLEDLLLPSTRADASDAA